MAPKFHINSKTLTAPLAAFCMASILFVYTKTSITAAKRNAKAHREADGGQINWGNESLRRHGVLEPPEDQNVVRQLLLGGGRGGGGGEEGVEGRQREEKKEKEDDRVRAAALRDKARREGGGGL